MNWEEALAANNNDYAYSSDGGMIERQNNGTYTVMGGNLRLVSASAWDDVEKVGLTKEEIPGALTELGMSPDDWSYE